MAGEGFPLLLCVCVCACVCVRTCMCVICKVGQGSRRVSLGYGGTLVTDECHLLDW